MSLSKSEQVILDQIERALDADDPELAASLVGTRPGRRRLRRAGATFVVGLNALVGGAVLTLAAWVLGLAVSVLGFIVMVYATWSLGSDWSDVRRTLRKLASTSEQ